MNTFVQNQQRNYDNEYLVTLSAVQLRKLAMYAEGINGDSLDAALKEVVRRKGNPTASDKTEMMRLVTSTNRYKDSHYKPEEAVISMGGSVFYTPKEIALTSVSGEVTVTPNAPVPSQFGVKAARKYVQFILPLCSQLVINKKGKWEIKIENAWSKVFSRSGLNISELHVIASLVLAVLEQDRVWMDMPSVSKLSTTGSAKLVFIKEALERIDDLAYIYLHTSIVVKFLRAVIPDGKKFVVRMSGDEPAIPVKSYESVKITPAQAKDFRKWTPQAYYYVGGFIPLVDVPVDDGTINSAYLSLQRLREFSGGDSSAVMLLAGMKDFSGLTTEAGKRLSFILAATLFCWSKKLLVDIRLSSMGDLFPLMSSLNLWKRIVATEWEEKPGGHQSTWVNFMPQARKAIPLDPSIEPYMISAHREDAVAIWWNADQLTTAQEKGKTVDHDLLSFQLLPADIVANDQDFIAYNPIYGPNMFPQDKHARPTGRTTPLPENDFDELFVYPFGNAAKFNGIVSTFDDLALWGRERVGSGKTAVDRFTSIKLQVVPSMKEWYAKVCTACTAHYSLTFNAVSRYSPISNLLYMSKKAVQIASAKEILGNLYEDIVLAPTASDRGVVVEDGWGSDEEEEEEVEESSEENDDDPEEYDPEEGLYGDASHVTTEDEDDVMNDTPPPKPKEKKPPKKHPKDDVREEAVAAPPEKSDDKEEEKVEKNVASKKRKKPKNFVASDFGDM